MQIENRRRQNTTQSQGVEIEPAQTKKKVDTRANKEDRARMEAQGSEEEQRPNVADKVIIRHDKLESKGELEGCMVEMRGVRDKGGVGGRDERGKTGKRNGRGGSKGRDEEDGIGREMSEVGQGERLEETAEVNILRSRRT